MNTVAAVLAVCRFGQDAAALLLWGASAYVAWLVPKDLAIVTSRQLRRWQLTAAIVTVVATFAKLPTEVASIGDGWRDAVNPAMAQAFLRETNGGQAWAAQAAAALLLLLAQTTPTRVRGSATALMSALVLALLSLGGHAVVHEGLFGLAHRINDVVHVLSAGAWLGALLPVLALLKAREGNDCRASTSVALGRFSRAGHVAVALVVLSGVNNTALVLGRWPTDCSSPYQMLLDAKILATAALIGMALVNRYVLVPRTARGLRGVATVLKRVTLAEVPLGLLATALVAVFGLLDPT